MVIYGHIWLYGHAMAMPWPGHGFATSMLVTFNNAMQMHNFDKSTRIEILDLKRSFHAFATDWDLTFKN